MKITREMYPGAADPYTDLLDILTRSLGINPMRVTLAEAVEKAASDGRGRSATIYDYRAYLEQFLERAFARQEAEGG